MDLASFEVKLGEESTAANCVWERAERVAGEEERTKICACPDLRTHLHQVIISDTQNLQRKWQARIIRIYNNRMASARTHSSFLACAVLCG